MCEGGWRAQGSFPLGVGVKQGCVMSCLLDILMNVCMREIKPKLGYICARLKMNGVC